MNNTKEPIFLDIGNKNAQNLVLGHSMRGYQVAMWILIYTQPLFRQQ
jgi:hypothetical protein